MRKHGPGGTNENILACGLAPIEGKMEMIDWIIFIIVFLVIASFTWVSKRYLASVADFPAANRCAGRYLLCISQGLAATGAVGIIGQFQIIYSTGIVSVSQYGIN